jgi:gamma-glutamyl AIG2-like cyclotransferase
VGRVSERHHVFGYASLVTDAEGHDVTTAELPGHRRVWGVATDNTRAIPGYKMYLLRSDGTRPAVYVAFLDLAPDPVLSVTGLVRAVSEEELERLDRRERNYRRVDVSGAIEGFDGRVWTYMGSHEGRERLARGREEGRAVVSRDYLEKVHAGFRRLGGEAHARFLESSALDDLPVWDLERIDLPEDPPAARDVA